MKSKLFKSLPNFSSNNVSIDRENGIIKNTAVANFGKNKNGSYFDEAFINDLLKFGNEAEGGIKSRFGHPNMCSTSLGTYIGRYRNFSIQNGNLHGDLYLDPISKKTQVEGKGITMFEYIMDMAENNPDVFGNSIHIYSELYEQDVDGESQIFHKLEKFKAVDLVDDPAATDSLFTTNSDDIGVILTNFLDEYPQIFETVSKKPEILTDFFERYQEYSKRKSLNFNTMGLLDKLKNSLGKKEDDKFDIDITLADGMIVTVKTDAETPKEGDEVVDDQGTPVADGEHLLPDGGSITTEGGKITTIKEKEETTDTPAEPTTAEVMQSVNNLEKKIEKMFSAFGKRFDNNEKGLEMIAGTVGKLGKEIKSKEFDHDGLEDEPVKNNKRVYDPEKAKELRESKK